MHTHHMLDVLGWTDLVDLLAANTTDTENMN